MKFKSILSIAGILITCYACKQPEAPGKTFTLKGKVSGSNTEYLLLGYRDSTNVYVTDTIPINQGSFSIQGHLINTQIVSLASNLAGRFVDDPNNIRFFLEPDNVEVTLREGEFSNAQIKGSKTQVEHENLNTTIQPFHKKIDLLLSKRKALGDLKKETDNDLSERELEKISDAIQRELDGIKNTQLNYADKHPRSYVSAEIISFYATTLPKDSLEKLYNRLDPMLKVSSYGLQILDQLNIVDVGDKAPDFSYEDLNGNMLSLGQFKGKMVLLDFGAAWCVPCKVEIPEVKRIYDAYHPKGLEIIGVSFDKDKESWKEYVQNENLNWHHIYEGYDKQEEESAISQSYAVAPIPAYILIDEKGIIIDRYGGADNDGKSLKDLEEKLKTITLKMGNDNS